MKSLLAIDFGTCNTYFSTTLLGGRVMPQNYRAGGNNDRGIDSALLTRTSGPRSGERQIGEKALNTFGAATDEDKQAHGLSLAVNFKPDIETSEKARQDSMNFLAAVLELYKKESPDFDPLKMDVIFGVPSEASFSYRNCLCQIARAAGYGNVRLLDEPFGALSSYQNEMSERAAKMMTNDSVLVVDFGGGTCDFAILQNGDIKHSWGDMLLGGRLIDDLFYQWVIDQSQNSSQPMTDDQNIQLNRDYYLRTVKCRELKEDFSDMIAAGVTDAYTPYFCNQYLLNLTQDEFIARMRAYRPSNSFRKHMRLPSDLSHTRFQLESPLDIIAWFERELKRGFEEKGIVFDSIQKVLLAGGSSKWTFSRKICQAIFPNAQIIDSENVFAAISMGLAKYAVIKNSSQRVIDCLENDKSRFIESIFKLIQESLENEKDVKAVGEELFCAFAQPELTCFMQKGGSIEEMENRLKAAIGTNVEKVKDILEPLFLCNGQTLDWTIQNQIKSWFKSCGVCVEEYQFVDLNFTVSEFISQNPDFWAGGSIAKTLSNVITDAVIDYFTWNGAFKDLVIGLFGKQYTQNYVKTTKFSSSWAKSAIDANKISSIRSTVFLPRFSEKIREFAQAFFKKHKNQIIREVQSTVEIELSNYRKVINMEAIKK